MKDTTGPAFPCDATVYPDGQCSPGHDGMTYRQWLCGIALQGMVYESARWSSDKGFVNPIIVAKAAVEYADALLHELGLT